MSVYAFLSVHRATDRAVLFDLNEDVTGWTFVFDVLETLDATTSLFQLTSGSGVTVTSASAGEVTVSLSAARTNMEPDTYYWCFSRTDTGAKDVLAYGSLTVLPPKAF